MVPPTISRARTLLSLLTLATIAGCGTWSRVGETQHPDPQDEMAQLFDPVALYTRLGRFVSPGVVHYIGSVAFVPGHGDSTLAIIGISLANRVFSFQKEGEAFGARYRVEYQLDHAGSPPIVVGRNEAIRVSSFQETLRSDESILLQQVISLKPGDYQLTVRVRDLANSEVGTATQKVTAAQFSPGSFTAPILTYHVRGRASRDDSLSILLNPRGTLAYGGDTLLIYFEGVGFSGPKDLPLQIRDQRDSLVFHTTVHFTGATAIEPRVVRIAPDSAPLGQLEIILGPESGTARGAPATPSRIATGPENVIRTTSAVVSFSSAWVVTNFDDLLSLLRYFGEDQRISAMKKAQGDARMALWKEFYKVTDPNPSTPENEALDLYFARVAVANQRFREQGYPGWKTDRGEVFITLGDPDEERDESGEFGSARGGAIPSRTIRWVYLDYRATLIFQDVTGFDRYQLTPSSRSDFDRVRLRVQHSTP